MMGLVERLLRRCGTRASLRVCSTSGKPPESCADAPSSTEYAAAFQAKLEALRPRESLLCTLSSTQRNHINKLVKELEVYLWMAPTCPQSMDDMHWRRLLTHTTVSDRVSFLRYLALSQHRASMDALKKKSVDEQYRKHMDQQMSRFLAGEMGYGPGMHQLLLNPLRNKKRLHQCYGSRVLNTLQLDDKPHIVFDMQCIDQMQDRRRSVIANQLQFLIAENLKRYEPFNVTFANFKHQLPANQRLLNNFVGFYSGEHTDQLILPDFVDKTVPQLYPEEKDIVYISRYAREVLDGPLRSKVYVVNASFDMNRESMAAARKHNLRAMRLPFKRYVRWQSGPQYLPFINLVRVLDEVYQSNGDWRSALLNNISKRHLRSPEETSAYAAFNSDKMKDKKREVEELVRMIEDATAHL